MVTTLSLSTKCRGKYSQCPAFDIKQSPAGRLLEDHQVRAHAYLCLNSIMIIWFECVSRNTLIGVLNQAWCLG